MGGSGGSQGSGEVKYAAYLETAHSGIIGTTTISQTLISTLNTMMATSPYALVNAFNPDTALAAMDSAIAIHKTAIDALLSDASIKADSDAYAAIIDDQLNTVVKPRFNAMMRDIGGVQSSAFVIGLANIEASRNRDVAKYTGESKMRRIELHTTAIKDNTQFKLDKERMVIAAKHDEEQRNSEIDTYDANWDIDCLLKGGQFLGALGGGTNVPDKPSKLGSAIAGGLSGAAAGFMIGGPAGAVAGGALGAGAAFL